MHAGIYDPCWYLRSMLVFTIHAGIYDPCWYLRSMLVYLRCMLVFTMHAVKSREYYTKENFVIAQHVFQLICHQI